jgi:hypothetical protein
MCATAREGLCTILADQLPASPHLSCAEGPHMAFAWGPWLSLFSFSHFFASPCVGPQGGVFTHSTCFVPMLHRG